MDDKAANATTPSTVLIIVRDILGGALIAALVEGIGKQPLFPIAGERADLAVTRLRPALIVLDCYHPAARADAFFAAVESSASRVVLFAPSSPWAEFEEIARRRQIAAFVHSKGDESLASLLCETLSSF